MDCSEDGAGSLDWETARGAPTHSPFASRGAQARIVFVFPPFVALSATAVNFAISIPLTRSVSRLI